MKTIRQLLEGKGHEIVSATSETSVYEALEIMAEHNIGALLVLDAGDLVGIFSERDYARKVVLKGKSSRGTSVGETMSRKVACVRADQTIEECMALMTDKHIRHLPVLEDEEVGRRDFNRGCGQSRHLRAGIPHIAARELHHWHSLAGTCDPNERSLFLPGVEDVAEGIA